MVTPSSFLLSLLLAVVAEEGKHQTVLLFSEIFLSASTATEQLAAAPSLVNEANSTLY